jgi:predicted nucleotidyltransferase
VKNDISVLAEKGETQALEYKASFDKATIESLVAFANARGDMPKSGMINPNMGTTLGCGMDKQTGLGDALFSITQQRVLGHLFGQPERSYFANELIALTGGGSGAVQRELKRLESSGLLTTERRGNQKHYQANPASPIYQELCGIVQKTFGLAGPLREALQPFAENIQAAFIYGSIAKKQDSAASDIDLMIVSQTLTYAELYEKLANVESHLGRQINPTLYSQQQIQQRIATDNAFVTRVLSQPKIWLIGDEDAITP